MMFGLKDKKAQQSNVILKRVSINGYVCGDFVEFTMSHLYENKTNRNIDAIYTFPIPDTAVLTGFEAALGGRTLKAVVERKEEAAKLINEAAERGVNSFSLERYEDNVFQINVGNILPNETVKIKISYMDQLIYEDGIYKLIIPSVIGPKFVPQGKLHDRFKEDDTLDSMDVEEGYKLHMTLFIESMTRLDFHSPTHEIKVEREDDTLSKVTLKHIDEYLDNDFIIFLKEINPGEASGMAYRYEDSEGKKGILYLKLFPRLDVEGDEESQNYCFLVDVSRSMKGEKLEEAKNALQLCIRNLTEDDRFNIIAFDSEIHQFSRSGKVYLTEETLKNATDWIENLEPSKGANVYAALKQALEEEKGEGKSTILLFTDDIVEKEEEILEFVDKNIADNRIFPIGIDTSVNSYFINRLAHIGKGKAEFIYPGERIDEMVLRQFNRITNPRIEVTEIDWGTMKVDQMYPRTLKYLYDREPFSIFARVSGDIEGKVVIKGTVGRLDYNKTIDLDDLDLEENARLIQKVWSRKRIESMEERIRMERGNSTEAMKNKITELSRDNGIISSYTTLIMLEQTEEPVLGMSMQHILPINISEDAAKDISEAYFLDSPTFFYSSDLREKMAEERIDENTAKSILRYDRENILRTIAKNQFVDGAFSNIDEMDQYNRVESTLLSLLAFTFGSEDINIYVNQVNKAIKYVTSLLVNEKEIFDEYLYSLTLIALKVCMDREILKGKSKEEGERSVLLIKAQIDNKKYIGILNVLNNSIDGIRQYTSVIMGISKNLIDSEEAIFSKDARKSINDLAILAISKTL